VHLRSPLQHHRARTGRCPSRDEIWRWARPRPSHGPSTRKMDLLAITLASIPSRACLSPSPRGFQDTDCEVVPGPLHAQGGCGYGWEMVGHLPVGATSTVSLFMVSEAGEEARVLDCALTLHSSSYTPFHVYTFIHTAVQQ
jgi:hypothetical protein